MKQLGCGLNWSYLQYKISPSAQKSCLYWETFNQTLIGWSTLIKGLIIQPDQYQEKIYARYTSFFRYLSSLKKHIEVWTLLYIFYICTERSRAKIICLIFVYSTFRDHLDKFSIRPTKDGSFNTIGTLKT